VNRRAASPAALAACLLLQACVYTHQEVVSPPPKPFEFRALPYPTYDADEGLQGHLLLSLRRPANRLPAPVSEMISLDARIATSGTRGVLLSWDRSGRSIHWRLYMLAGAERLRRAPYYGVGNDAVLDDSLEALFPHYYRYQLLRTTGYVAYQHDLGTPRVRLHLATQWRHYAADALADSTLLARDVASGVLPGARRTSTGEFRLGLLYDSRDEEATPSRGLLMELMSVKAVGDHVYTRYLIGTRVFVPLDEFESWVVALRQTTELSHDTVPFYVAYERLTTWYLEDGFGGPRSLRLQPPGRYVAPNRVVVSADLRHKVIDVPDPRSPFRLWMLGFGDVGRLWNAGESPKLRGLHWSAGLGGRLQMAKGTLFGVDLGATDAGFGFAISTVFAF
jgi:surface antigen Omp85-like protein